MYEGFNRYTETEASGSPSVGSPGEENYGQIAQHYLENSNVQIVEEMVDMIAAQRAYELNSKSIQTADEMLRKVANMK
jgi:flagellar basal-body rod protein FlgG